ncbi:MAG: MFS transporter, partial [Alphaproteobacteria bacterium]|nr:MFS transporter [Alphaproteobacteria bacterium]
MNSDSSNQNESKRKAGRKSEEEARDLVHRVGAAQFAATPPDEPPSEQEIAEISQPGATRALLRVFRHRNYRLYFSGQLVSLMGTWMQNVAQSWLVYSLTHSPLLLGVTSFSSTVTVFFVTPFG